MRASSVGGTSVEVTREISAWHHRRSLFPPNTFRDGIGFALLKVTSVYSHGFEPTKFVEVLQSNLISPKHQHETTAGMMNVFSARCTAPNCLELATFGIPGIKRPTHCAGHRDQHQHVRITSYHS